MAAEQENINFIDTFLTNKLCKKLQSVLKDMERKKTLSAKQRELLPESSQGQEAAINLGEQPMPNRINLDLVESVLLAGLDAKSFTIQI